MTGSSADFSTSASKDLGGKLGAFDELQSKILESITDGFVAFDKKWCYTYVNSNAARILRKSKEELLGKVCWDIFPEASKLRFFAEFNKAAKTGVPVHFEAFYPEPMNVWYECHCYPSEDGLTVFFSDVSNRKVAEEEIKAHRELFETVINSLLAAVIIIRGSDLKIILVNPAYNLIAPRKAMVGKAIQEVWPEIQPRFENLCRQVLNTGEPYHTLDEPFRIRRFSDDPLELAYFSWSLFRVRLPSNEGWGILNTFWETTKRKKTEEDLRASEERLKRSQEIAHLGSWELDLISNRLSWSDEVYRIFGLKPQEFGATYEAFLDAVHPDDRSAVDAAYTGSLREGKGTYEIEHRIVRKSNGEIRVVHEKCEHVRDEPGKIIKSIGMVHDITERKKAEEKIERLASFPDLNPNPVVEADFDGNIEYVNPATKKIFPDLETLGLRHPFLSEWESVVNTFRVKKLPTFGREIKIGEHWYHQQFSLQKIGAFVFTQKILMN